MKSNKLERIERLQPLMWVSTPNNGWSSEIRRCFEYPNILDRDDAFTENFIDEFVLSGKVTSKDWVEVPSRYIGDPIARKNFTHYVKWA